MEKEQIVILKVDTEEAVQSVGDLRNNIKTLKERLNDLDIDSEAYRETLKELKINQSALKDAMNATSSSMEDIARASKTAYMSMEELSETNDTASMSYNQLVHRLRALKEEWRATTDSTKRDNLGQQIAEVDQALKDLDASVGMFKRNVGNYKSALDGVSISTENFGDAMRDSMQVIEPTKQKFESVNKISTGLMSGFMALKGTMTLLGVEGEKLDKTFATLQVTMGIMTSLGGISGLVEGLGRAKVAFNNLGNSIKTVSAAMGATGWLAVIAAVGAAITLLITNLKKKKEAVEETTDAIEGLDRANANLLDSEKERSKQLEREIKLMSAQGASEEEILQKRLEFNSVYLNASKRNYDEAQKQYLGLKDSLEMGIKGVTEDMVNKAKEAYDKANDIYKGYSEKRKDILNDMTINEIKVNKEKKETEEKLLKETQEKEAQILKERDNLVSKFLEDSINEMENLDLDTELELNVSVVQPSVEEGSVVKEAQVALNAIKKTYDDLRAESELYTEDEKTRLEELANYTIQEEERKLQRLKELHQKAVESGDNQSSVLLLQQIAEQEVELERTKYKELEKLRKEDLEREEEAKKKRMDIFNASMSSVANLVDGIADIYESDEKSAEENAEKIKGLRIAAATIDTIQGAVAAYTSAQSLGFPLGPIIGGINAAAVTAMGIANINKIRNTDPTGKSQSSLGSTVTPNTSTYTQELPVNYVRNVTSQSEIDEMNKEQRVYILESDIQESSKRVAVRESESSF